MGRDVSSNSSTSMHVTIENGESLASEDTLLNIESQNDAQRVALESIDNKLDNLNVSVSNQPTDYATITKQDTGNTSLDSIDSKLSSTNIQINQTNTKLDTLHSDHVSTNNKLDSVIANQTNATQKTQVTNFPATQPVSVASLPLPAGAGTEATLSNIKATLDLIKAKTDNLDVLLSTRTKPADSQHVTVDNPTVAVSNPVTTVAVSSIPEVEIKNDAGNPVNVTQISGFATSAKQDTLQTAVDAINTKTPALISGRQPVDVQFPATQTVSFSNVPNTLVSVVASAIGNATVVAAPGAGLSIYVKSIMLSSTLTATLALSMTEGVGGTARKRYATTAAFSFQEKTEWKLPANTALVFNSSAAIAAGVNINIEYLIV